MKTSEIVLAALLGATVMLTGCSEKKAEEVPGPVAFDKHDRCLLCGMVIAHYEGPKAEVFIKGEKEPIKFCSGRDAFTYALQPENARRLRAFYVHDMGRTEWANPSDAALTDATKAVWVYGHDIAGVMGNEPAGFADKNAALAFIQKHGGKLYGYTDVTLELLDK